MNPDIEHLEWVKLVTKPAEILIVEDDKPFAELVLTVAEDFHCCPTVAADGETAVELLRNNTYNVVLVDYKLPRMSGYDLLQHIFSLSVEVPVVVLSGVVSPQIILEISELGVVPFVCKPNDKTIPSLGRLFRTLQIKPRHTPCGRCSTDPFGRKPNLSLPG